MPPPTPPPPNKPAPQRQPNWQSLIGFVLVFLLLLWMWQSVYEQITVRTIPYSRFKTLLAQDRVISCEVDESEINGEARGKSADEAAPDKKDDKAKPQGKADEAKPGVSEKTGGSKPATPVAPPAEKAAPPTDAATKTSATAPPAAKESTPAAAAAPPTTKSPDEKSKDAKASTTGSKADSGKAEEQPTFMFRTVRVDDPQLVAELEAHHVEFKGVKQGFLSTFMLLFLPPLVLMLVIWFGLRRLGAAGQAVMRIGKSNARMAVDKQTGVTFADVAGCDEAKFELEEVVDFLKNPKRYVALGAKIPKGVLLIGPPGTGKTLLARAVAGEAHVPFFSLSGSEFVEMFVGVGASRVRDLFEQAKSAAPCIVFIDELDAIGRERGVHVGAVNDEREQTLNQLLVEMDGFEANAGVILLAATNRPEVLDRALLRPGRFDRQVVVDAPDLAGREAILKVHIRKIPLATDVDLHKLAQGTPGFSGADLANVINEAALLAARRNASEVAQRDLEEAVEKVVAGPERKSRRLGEEEKRRVAYHETGHALVGAFSQFADPIHKISIVPRGRHALGYTLQVPAEEQFLMTRAALVDRLKGLLGGRAAEELIFHEVSTGAENDLQRATSLARQMVTMYGMSDTIGLVHVAERRPMFLPGDSGSLQLDCSDETARRIDGEVKNLLDSAYVEAKKILTAHHAELETVARELLRTESLDAATFNRLIGRSPDGKDGHDGKLTPAAASGEAAVTARQ